MGLDFMCGLTSCGKLLKVTEEVANFDTSQEISDSNMDNRRSLCEDKKVLVSLRFCITLNHLRDLHIGQF